MQRTGAERLELTLDVKGGWLRLGMRHFGGAVDFASYWLTDGLTAFVVAIEEVLAGRTTVAMRFHLEVAGGPFLDLVQDPDEHTNIAVSPFRYGPDSTTAETTWSAERGQAVFTARVPTRHLVDSVLRELRRIRVTAVDATGFAPHWGRTFPQARYEQLEAAATARFGYKPPTTDEITSQA